jgi:hypothetical protein
LVTRPTTGGNAINEIQLMGDSSVVGIGKAYALSNGTEKFDSLLIQLREDLRKELNLDPLAKINPYEFRMRSNYPVKDTLTSKDQTDLIIKINEDNQNLIK